MLLHRFKVFRLLFVVTTFLIHVFLPKKTLAKDSRDEDIFGSSAQESASPPAPVPTPVKSSENTSKAQTSLEDRLQVGGRLELKYTAFEKEGVNPGKGDFQQLSRGDLYFDGRPPNLKENYRGFLRLRFSESHSESAGQVPTQQVSTEVDELWIKGDVSQKFFLTLGRQHLKWGSGRLWNPTDFTASVARDPFASFDARLGQDLFKIHWPWEKGGHNFYMIIDSSRVRRSDDLRLLLRGEISLGSSAELALSLRKSREGPDQLGIDWSGALGPLDLYVESAFHKRNPMVFYTGQIDPQTLEVPVPGKKDHKTLRQTVVGLQYGVKYLDDDTLTAVLEYFDNELGYEARDLELYALVRGGGTPITVGRRYAGLLLNLPSPGSWNDLSLLGSAIKNLSDQTALAQVTTTYAVFGGLSIQGTVSRCFGDVGSLCFRVPESFKSLAADPRLGPQDRELLGRLPTQRTLTVFSLGVTMEI